MKQNNHFSIMGSLVLLAGLTLAALTTSCGRDDEVTKSEEVKEDFPERYDSSSGMSSSGEKDGRDGREGAGDPSYYDDLSVGGEGSGGPGSGTQNGNSSAGVVTAAEWCDLTHWDFWAQLLQSQEFSGMSDYWKCYTDNRVAVKVTEPGGKPCVGSRVELVRASGGGKATLWTAVTDNHGLAECWVGFFQRENAKADELLISIDGQLMDGNPQVSSLGQGGNVAVNTYTVSLPAHVNSRADIAFIVDATGSMGDEIGFLKNDLTDIIGKAASVRPDLTIRTAALFYRDEDDEYLTRPSNFSDNLSVTTDFIAAQRADGGGDYPEAVHTALEGMLQDLSWDENARTRLAFLVLDAPPHYASNVIASLQQSIATAARMGIRLIPVAASGVDKNTEMLMRFFAIATGGTYVFITNDSGVGNDHIEASVGDHEVELLNSLILRLIKYYTE